MAMSYGQLEAELKKIDGYSDNTHSKNAVKQAFKELEAEAGEVPHLKAEIDRLIARNVALDVQLREAKAQPTIPPAAPSWYPNTHQPVYPPGVRVWNDGNTDWSAGAVRSGIDDPLTDPGPYAPGTK